MPIRTSVYRLTRSELILLGVREYLRTFWWFALITPTFGIALLLVASGPLQVIGYTAVIWPFSIPARASIASFRSSRLFCTGCWMDARSDEVVFYGSADVPKPLRFRLPLSDVRAVFPLGDLIVLQTRRFGLVPIKQRAFESTAECERFQEMVYRAIDMRLGPPEA